MENCFADSSFIAWSERERIRRERHDPFDSQSLDTPAMVSETERRKNPRRRFIPVDDTCLQV